MKVTRKRKGEGDGEEGKGCREPGGLSTARLRSDKKKQKGSTEAVQASIMKCVEI